MGPRWLLVIALVGCGRLDFDSTGPAVVHHVTVSGGSVQHESITAAAAVDDSGNLYLGGGFSTTLDFGLGPLTASASVSIYVSSFGPDLTPRWDQAFAATGTTSQVSAMVATRDGLVILGPFQGSVDFGGGPIASMGGDDRFLVNLDLSSGAYQRAASFGSTADDDNGIGLAVSGDGTVYAGGGCNGAVFHFGGAALAGTTRDACVGEFSATGALLDQRRWPNPLDAGMLVLASDPAGLIASGFFAGTLDLDGIAMTSGGGKDGFVTRLGTDLTAQWAVQISSAGDDIVPGVARGTDGSIYFAGFGTGPITIAGRSLPMAGVDGFIGQLAPDGTLQWVRVIGDTQTTEIHDLVVHGDELVVAGHFMGTLTLDGVVLDSAGGSDGFAAGFEVTTGRALWAKRFGGPLDDEARVVATAGDQLYVAGFTTGVTESTLFIDALRY